MSSSTTANRAGDASSAVDVFSSPLFYDMHDLENEMRLLAETNRELAEMLEAEDDEGLRVVLAENESAIEAKRRRANELRKTLGIPPVTYPPLVRAGNKARVVINKPAQPSYGGDDVEGGLAL